MGDLPAGGLPGGAVHRLVYVSRNLLGGTDAEVAAEVERILVTSRRNNARDGITGALFYNEDCFAQMLEGELAALHRAFERIQSDARHRDTVVLACEPVAGRAFGDWSMAHVGRGTAVDARYAALSGPGAGAGGRVLDLLCGVLARTTAPVA